MTDHHFPCPCGAELADECPSCARSNPLGSMRLDPIPAQRRDWFSSQYECSLPDDADDRADYLTQLAHEAEHGPAAGQEHLA